MRFLLDLIATFVRPELTHGDTLSNDRIDAHSSQLSCKVSTVSWAIHYSSLPMNEIARGHG